MVEIASVRHPVPQRQRNDLAQFTDESKEVILRPAEYKTGSIIYPYQDAKKK